MFIMYMQGTHFGEHRYTTSARGSLSYSGKNPFSGVHGMYTMFLYCDVALSISPVCPNITL
jgi:hypothetical protein